VITKLECKKLSKENVLSNKDNVSDKVGYESLKSNRTFHDINPKHSKRKIYYNFPHFLKHKGKNNSQITFRASPNTSHSPKSSSNRKSVSGRKSYQNNMKIQSHKQLPYHNPEIYIKKYSNCPDKY
jgi:hypothetical protein